MFLCCYIVEMICGECTISIDYDERQIEVLSISNVTLTLKNNIDIIVSKLLPIAIEGGIY